MKILPCFGLEIEVRCVASLLLQASDFALEGQGNVPLVRVTSNEKAMELCKGHHSKSTGHKGNCCWCHGLFGGLLLLQIPTDDTCGL